MSEALKDDRKPPQIAYRVDNLRTHSFRPLVRLGIAKGFHIEPAKRKAYRGRQAENVFNVYRKGIAIAKGNAAGITKWLLQQPNLRGDSNE
jgi:hypothetical protein